MITIRISNSAQKNNPRWNGRGESCAVANCKNNRKALSKWKKEICSEHGMQHEDCPCLIPFKLHQFPAQDDIRQQWIAKLNRNNFVANKHSRVCSIHFPDGRPTKINPVPQLLLELGPMLDSNSPVKKSKTSSQNSTEKKKVQRRKAGKDNSLSTELPRMINTEEIMKPADEDMQIKQGIKHCPTCTCPMHRQLVDVETQWEDLSECDVLDGGLVMMSS